MFFHRVLPFLVLGATLTACDGKLDDSAAADATTVERICDKIFELCDDHYGWTSAQACYDSFLGSEAKGTNCADEAGYLRCMPECDALGTCDDFRPCEEECWADNCS